jgi:predicted TIM-barrel fold metal-dependent hydrolase
LCAVATIQQEVTDHELATLLKAAPKWLLWRSDWPHVMQGKPMPNDGDLSDFLSFWVPDEDIRQRVLVDNPSVLYGSE